MKVTFYSNYLNHHQIPFCSEMYKLLGDDYKFVSTETMNMERIKLGYSLNKEQPFELRPYENDSIYNYCLELGLKSDIVITGSAPEIFIQKRLEKNKLTLRYSERFFKKGAWRIVNPKLMRAMLMYHTRYRNKNLYMLCASAYTALDAAIIGAYPNKTYKWGYFTEVKEYNIKSLFANKKNEPIILLWCGRFIDWKHPEKAIIVMKRLKEDGYYCRLNLIGDGPLRNKIEAMVSGWGLADRINFLGSMSPCKVREYMDKANILLFTSDRQEGWGAVLNEAMNSGCAIVASHAIGSVPFLIEHGQNGFKYMDNDINDLYKKTELLVKSSELREKIGRNAIKTIEEKWNPKIAAERLIEFCKGLLAGKIVNFEDGPCSKA